MKDFCCSICGNTFSGHKGNKYCSIECRLSGRKLNRNNGIRKARKNREIDKPCLFCGRTFVTWNSSKHYCSELCRINSGIVRNASKPKRPIPKSNCCICGAEYDLFYVKTVTCRDKTCIKAHALDMKHRRIANGTPKTRDKQQIKDLIQEFQIVDAICPGCGVVHKYKFEPAWIGNGTPRKRCQKYPACMAQDLSGLLSVRRRYQDTFETDNRSII